jgi:preprotein translocase subunit SecG
MILIFTVLHLSACILLITSILLQAGRGGGMSEMFGGGMQAQQKMFGSDTNTFMTKATTFCAVLFVITSVTLGVLTTRKSRSLVTPSAIKPMFPSTAENVFPDGDEIEALQGAVEKAPVPDLPGESSLQIPTEEPPSAE